MACNDIHGINWVRGLLVVDGTNRLFIDPRLNISNPSGHQSIGRFQALHETDFNVTCTDNGTTTIQFTRDHPADDPEGITRTTYSGIVVNFGQRAVVGIIRGRFERTLLENGQLVTLNGDWETERPT